MIGQSSRSTTAEQITRWTARGLSIFCVAITLFFVYDIFTREGGLSGSFQLEWKVMIALVFFPIGVAVGMLLAWWREGLGAIVIIGSQVTFCIITLLLLSEVPNGLMFVLFFLPGFLFGLAWLLSRRNKNAVVDGGYM